MSSERADALLSPVSTPDAPAPAGSYSQAVVWNGLAFLAGQAPFRVDGTVPASLEDQVCQALANLEAVAAAAGSSLDRAVQMRAFLSPRADFASYNRAYSRVMGDPPWPARTTVRSEFSGFDVEIDAIVVVGTGGGSGSASSA
jgi:2-iminobutanoate/2-iminopropanoate deaminase